MKRKFLIGAALTALWGCVSDYHSASTDALRPLITVTDDPLDHHAYASTDNIRLPFRELGNGGVDSDIWFRVAKRNGVETIYLAMWTEADDWLHPSHVNFGDPLRSVEVEPLDYDVDCRSYGCEHLESFVAKLSPADVDALYSAAIGAGQSTDIRIKTRAGRDVDRTIRMVELDLAIEALEGRRE